MMIIVNNCAEEVVYDHEGKVRGSTFRRMSFMVILPIVIIAGALFI